ncbi:peptidoglycan editing factor PgeF [Sneathiella limimaris]|uniref:peptidoglycan editing factor PgeF n=1 Tax=Sneathiella limimaris TaxID=1964213 RepID=UPI00146C8CDE|nr:peptidoglycan editing factor PgeF [Sneathiella limimaris]
MYVKAKNLTNAGVQHAFFTRENGVSEGIYAGLNCGPGSNDDAVAVAENRKRAMAELNVPAANLYTLYQIHSADVIAIDENSDPNTRPKGDAMVTNQRNVALGILTADCVPILFYDAKNSVIGAAHSGWKGTLSGIFENVIDEMVSLGAEVKEIHAAIGPSIQQPSYEVGPEFPEPFLKKNSENRKYFIPSSKSGHFLFDLTGLVLDDLNSLPLKSVERLTLDTYKEEDLFYSYRRTCHRKEPDYGRQLSAITLV